MTTRTPSSHLNSLILQRLLLRSSRLSGATRSPGATDGAAANRSEQGLTILECVMAMVVTMITMTMITPPLLIATATRVKNQRAEQAFQVAQAEVDRIRTLVARGEHRADRLPAVVSGNLQNYAPFTAIAPNLVMTNATAAVCTSQTPARTKYTNQSIAANQALMVDVNEDCDPDLLLQTFRDQRVMTTTEANRTNAGERRPSEFTVGVRVYWIRAGDDPSRLENPVRPVSLGLSQGEGKQRVLPYAMVYTPFSWSERSSALCSYFQRSTDPTERARADQFCGSGTFAP